MISIPYNLNISRVKFFIDSLIMQDKILRLYTHKSVKILSLEIFSTVDYKAKLSREKTFAVTGESKQPRIS